MPALRRCQQLVGRDVDQDDFVRAVQHGVGHGLLHADAGDGAHRAIEAFQMLDIEGAPHVNARIQQLLHVLPAFGVARALDIAVRQFIDQQHRRMGGQGGVQVEFKQGAAAVGHLAQRQLREAGQQFGGFAAAMGFDHADQHLPSRPVLALRGIEHGVGLAHAGAGAEVNAQLAAAGALPFTAKLLQQLIGVGAGFCVLAKSERLSCQVAGDAKGNTKARVQNVLPTDRTSAVLPSFCGSAPAELPAW